MLLLPQYLIHFLILHSLHPLLRIYLLRSLLLLSCLFNRPLILLFFLLTNLIVTQTNQWLNYMAFNASTSDIIDLDLSIFPNAIKIVFMPGDLGLLVYDMISVEKVLTVAWSTPSKSTQDMENKSMYIGYTHFLMKENNSVDTHEKLVISMDGMSSLPLPLSVIECTKLHHLCLNMKLNVKMGRWKNGAHYNVHTIYIGKYEWLQRMEC